MQYLKSPNIRGVKNYPVVNKQTKYALFSCIRSSKRSGICMMYWCYIFYINYTVSTYVPSWQFHRKALQHYNKFTLEISNKPNMIIVPKDDWTEE